MAIKHRQLIRSKEGKDATDRSSETSLLYLVTGSDVIDDMRTYMEGVVPNDVDGLDYRCLSRSQLARSAWIWEAHYVEPDLADLNNKLATLGSGLGVEEIASFDTTGSTAVIFATSSDPAILSRYGTNPTDHKGAINVTKNEVKGTEIVVPALKLTYKVRLPKATITGAYIKTLARLTGTTNNATFKTDWAAGELLFLGATGQRGTKTDPEVTFHFAASENVTGMTIGEIAGIAKKGHDYLWVEFEQVSDATAVALARRPKAVYVHKVYREAAWAALGIGV